MDAVTKSLLNDFSKSNGTANLDEADQFEHFVAYSIVSSRNSDDFDTNDIVTGGGGDLNIDAFAVFVNGRLVEDAQNISDLLELNGYIDVEFIIIQSKTSSNFDGSAILALGDNLVKELFSDAQRLPCNDDIKRLIGIKEKIFQNSPKLRGNPVCRVYYVTTGTLTNDPYLETVRDRKRQELVDTNLFSEVHFELIGAKALQDFYRATKTSISREIVFEKLVTLPNITGVDASYLGVLPSTEFLKLISDDGGNIVKSVFVDNVRDFQGENPVNTDIAQTIKDGLFDQFVLRNNGVTIVANEIRVTSNKFTLSDYQIVNGCQTSHVIFANKGNISPDLLIPVKFIHTKSDDVTQSIIKSTNKQTPVDENDLLALTRFQRDIEDFYAGMSEEIKLYYERRAKQYSSRTEIEKGRIISIGIQLKCFASMFLDLPHQAGRYYGTLLKSEKDNVFKANHKPDAYYTSAFTLYRFDVAMRRLVGDERKIRAFKFLLLTAFRYRYETTHFTGADHKKIAAYCASLNAQLKDVDSSKNAFDECKSIVLEAANTKDFQLVRDSSKVKSLTEEVKRLASTRNPLNQPR